LHVIVFMLLDSRLVDLLRLTVAATEPAGSTSVPARIRAGATTAMQ